MSIPCTPSRSEDLAERKDLTVQSSGEETNAIPITNTISLPKFWKRSSALWFGQWSAKELE